MEVGLVSCTKSKREEAAKPKDLYLEAAFFSHILSSFITARC